MSEDPSADTVSVDALVHAFYQSMAGRDWDRLRSLFMPGAILLPVAPLIQHKVPVKVMDLMTFLEGAKHNAEPADHLVSEVARSIDRFGCIAQVFSTYAKRPAPDAEDADGFGVNSFQLVRDQERWWIASLSWDEERPDNPLPEKYMPHREG